MLGELEDFCVEVFGIQPTAQGQTMDETQSQAQREQAFLNAGASSADLAAHYLRLEDMPQDWLSGEEEASQDTQAEAQPEAVAAQPEETVPAVGTVLLSVNYEGPALPNNYTMDKLSLGALETVNPILGHLNSTYGYRDHPVDGEYKFHNGVDIGGQEGDPIGAFAAGTVEYIGENDDHGLYLQIDHGNGVKSFYATAASCACPRGRRWPWGRRWLWWLHRGIHRPPPASGDQVQWGARGPGLLRHLPHRLSAAGRGGGQRRFSFAAGLA